MKREGSLTLRRRRPLECLPVRPSQARSMHLTRGFFTRGFPTAGWLVMTGRLVAGWLVAGSLLAGCGRMSFEVQSTAEDDTSEAASQGVALHCASEGSSSSSDSRGSRSHENEFAEAPLLAQPDSLNPLQRATLAWDPGERDCRFAGGSDIPKNMQGIVQFASLRGQLDVYSVAPWKLVEADEARSFDLSPGQVHTVSVTNDADQVADQVTDQVTVEFTHDEGWISLRSVLAKVASDGRDD